MKCDLIRIKLKARQQTIDLIGASSAARRS
jgi:hypothetical protein